MKYIEVKWVDCDDHKSCNLIIGSKRIEEIVLIKNKWVVFNNEPLFRQGFSTKEEAQEHIEWVYKAESIDIMAIKKELATTKRHCAQRIKELIDKLTNIVAEDSRIERELEEQL